MPDFLFIFFFGLQIFINFDMNFMGLDYRFDFHIYPLPVACVTADTCETCEFGRAHCWGGICHCFGH